jgi:uncharacterized protein involved in exopolysaccharide biosynthesis
MSDAQHHEHDDDAPSKLGTVSELLGFFVRGSRRHRRLMWSVCALGLAGGVFAAVFAPPVFDSNCKILVQKSSAMQLLSNPHANVQNESSGDTMSSAPNIILRRDNLVAVIEETKLWDRWVANRPPLFGLKDKVMRSVMGDLTDEMKQRVLIGILEKKVFVSPDEGSILKIRVEWQDADTAFALVSAFETRFLADKSTSEASVTSEAIAILEEESKRAAQGIDTALADLLKVNEKMKTSQRPRAPGVTPPAVAVRPGSAPAPAVAPAPVPAAPTVNVAALLAEKRAAIRTLRDPWQQHLADLRAQMASLRATYTEQHPQVVTLQAQITAASIKPAELVALEEDEKKLLSALSAQAAPLPPTVTPAPPRSFVRAPAAPTAPEPLAPQDAQLTWNGTTLAVGEAPEVVAARDRLTAATRKYEDVSQRLDTARIQLQSLQAAFKYRFIVVQPPEPPRKPTKPNRLLLLLAGIIGGMVLGMFGGGVKDLLRGRFIEPWQVSRRLRLPLLAEVKVELDVPEP